MQRYDIPANTMFVFIYYWYRKDSKNISTLQIFEEEISKTMVSQGLWTHKRCSVRRISPLRPEIVSAPSWDCLRLGQPLGMKWIVIQQTRKSVPSDCQSASYGLRVRRLRTQSLRHSNWRPASGCGLFCCRWSKREKSTNSKMPLTYSHFRWECLCT